MRYGWQFKTVEEAREFYKNKPLPPKPVIKKVVYSARIQAHH